jgi:hypothetical protein
MLFGLIVRFTLSALSGQTLLAPAPRGAFRDKRSKILKG